MKATLLCLALALAGSASGQSQPVPLPFAEQAALKEARQRLMGTGYPRDPQQAILRYRQIAAQGSTAAMIELGLLYKNGIYTAANRAEALRWFEQAAASGSAAAWYHLGMLCKEGVGSDQDLLRSYRYFEQGAAAGDQQSQYAQAYMLFKGLGTQQDYARAVQLFTQTSGNPASMYFLGLCYRNGYGVQADTATGNHWLRKAKAQGYALAAKELKSAPENSNTAAMAIAAGQQRTIDTAAGTTGQLDQLPACISGRYEGYLIRYDWSGTHAIGAARLVVNMVYHAGRLEGIWQEDDSIQLSLHARQTPGDALVFEQMAYEKKDHYSPDKAMFYRFDTARLRWRVQGNEMLLQGPITQFSLQRNEPEKPLVVFLKKVTSGEDQTSLRQAGSWAADAAQLSPLAEDGQAALPGDELAAYPNPFDQTINLRFGLVAPAHVVISLLDVAGVVLYRHNARVLAPGNHTLQVQPKQKLRAGTYLLRLEYGTHSKTLKIVKS